ncbi:hypothetical protein HPP92_008790 [Vanilla planifolia]|nr:hypothetical protein HPP92_008790 [Vanilla planifolia]
MSPWLPLDDQPAGMGFPLPVSGIGGGVAGDYLINEAALAALQCYLPSNDETEVETDDVGLADPLVDAYSCDEFRIYEFKVRRCARGRSHDWTECPYAHPGEKARRRDPRKFHYSGTSCADFRKGNCKKGDACEFAHGVFECWLHPARYRTQPCKDGMACRRRVCFFAHTPEQLRVLPQQQSPRAMDSYDESPRRHLALDAYFSKGLISSSPTSKPMSPPLSTPIDSPPMSPSEVAMRRASWPVSSTANEVLASLMRLQLNKMKPVPSSWGCVQVEGGICPSIGSGGGGFRSCFCSLPSTPTTTSVFGGGWLDLDGPEWEEHVERVESGRALRVKMYERLCKETGLDPPESGLTVAAAPDVGWVSELVK